MGGRVGGFLGLVLAGCAVFAACGEGREPYVPAHRDDAGESGSGGRGGGNTGADGGVGADDGVGGGDDGEPIPIDEMLDPLVAAQCSYFERCEPPGYLEHVGGCLFYQRRILANYGYAALVWSVENGTATYDPEIVPACLSAVRDSPCDRTVALSECVGAWGGTLALGDACTFGAECVSGICSGCPGSCVALPQTGEDCLDESICRAGNYCDATGRCTPMAVVGEACNSSSEEYLPCRDSACVSETFGAGTCQPYRTVGLGSECISIEVNCDHGLDCASVGQKDDGTTDYRCVPESTSRGSCRYGTCPVGEDCVVPVDASDRWTGSCEPLPEPGERCRYAHECGPFAYCSLSNFCVAMVDLGDECRFDIDCVSGDCADGTCVLRTDCSIEDPEVRDTVCPTVAPFGRVFDGFDDDSTLPEWVVDDSPNDISSVVSHTADGLSCPGALRLDVPNPTYAGRTSLTNTRELDWTELSALHAWIKLAEPSPGDSAPIGDVYFGYRWIDEANTVRGTSNVFSLADLADNQWHDAWLTLDPEHVDKITSIVLDFEHLAPDPETDPATPPAFALLLDDIWVE